MKYSESYNVHLYHTDYRGLLTPAHCARYMQETAHRSLQRFGPSLEEMVARRRAFVLSKIIYTYLLPVRSCDDIRVETWHNGGHGVIFTRYYQMFLREPDGSERLAAHASSAWALIDTDTQRVCRTSEIEINPALGAGDAPDYIPPVHRLHMPPDAEMQHMRDFRVGYSDIDYNMHLNNARYLDVIADAAAEYERQRGNEAPFDGQAAESVEVSHVKEAPFGELLSVRLAKTDDGRYLVKAARSDGQMCFEAEMKNHSAPPADDKINGMLI